MTTGPDRFPKIFWIVAGLHIGLVVVVMFYSVIQRWMQRLKEPETVTFVSLYTPPAPTPPAPPAVAPIPPAPAPTPPAPAVVQEAPRPPPRQQIQRSTERVRRDPPPQQQPQQPALTPEQIRRQLEQAVPTGATPSPSNPDNLSRYYSLIHQTLYQAWEQPASVLPGTRVEARIRIQRDGSVVGRELVRRSGNPTMDDSIMRALQSVARIAPLPREITGAHHDFTIEFELTGAL